MNLSVETRAVPAPVRALLSPLEGTALGLFFVSGASALVYEVVWTRQLTNVFGGSAYAVATVLAAFMAGLALGSTLFGRWIDRRGHPLRVYGLLEGGIGLWALLLPSLLSLLDRVYAGLYQGLDPGFYTLSLVRFVLCFLVLLVPTTMMGGTLPVLGKLLLSQQRLGVRAGLLYGANTLGAVLGSAAGGFFLLPALGLAGSTWVAVGLNLLVAATAVVLAGRIPLAARPAEPAPARPAGPRAPATLRLHRTVLWVYAASGFAALAYEVAWTKTLSMVLGNTTYAFTAMLTTFLLGLSLGSFVFGRLADRSGKPEALLAFVQAGIPVLALFTIPILQMLPGFFVAGFPKLEHSWLALETYRVGLAGLTMFLPTVLMGGTFPLVTRIYVGGGETGRQLGSLYAANTVGAILGSFLTGFVLIPWLGRQDSILAASFVNLAAALLLVGVIRWSLVPRGVRWGLVAVAVLLVPAWILGLKPWNPRIMASGAYVYAPIITAKAKTIERSMEENNLLFYDEATEATVSVWLTNYIISLRTNGKIEASTHGDMITQKMISHLAVLYHRTEPQDALMIGLASGISAGALLTHPLRHLDTVELLPSMLKAARYFEDYNYHCLDDPRNHIIINDGRNHLLLTAKSYDVIVSEPSNPWISGVGSLFTRQFFQLTKKHLRPGGVVCQWVQTYQFQERDLKTVLATFIDAYPYLHLWQGAPGDLILVASQDPLELDLDRLRTAMAGKPGQDFAQLEILPLAQILSLFVTDRAGLQAYVDGWPDRVTDDNLYLEYAVPRHMFDTTRSAGVDLLYPYRVSPVGFLTGGGVDSSLAGEIRAYQTAREIAVAAKNHRYPPGVSDQLGAAEAALRIAPKEVTARGLYSNEVNEAAIQELLANDQADAEVGFRKVLATGTNQERAIALNNLGAIAFNRGALDSARTLWEEALRREPFYPTVIKNLSLVSERERDFQGALALLRRALPLDRKDPDLLNSLAYRLAAENQDLDEAESLARKAVSLDPDPNYRDTLGYVLLKRERWREAEKVLASIVEKDPGAWESLLHLGMARAGLGQTGTAREAFRTVIERSSDPHLVEQARSEMEKL